MKLRSLRRKIFIIRAVPYGDPEQLQTARDILSCFFSEASPLLGITTPPPPPTLPRYSVYHTCTCQCVCNDVAVCNFVHEILIIWIFYISFLMPEDRLESQSQIDQV